MKNVNSILRRISSPGAVQWMIVIVLAILVLVVFSQVGRHEFINFDDNIYITNNSRVKAGLSWSNIRWAFTTTYASNWHPVTWLSHMTDVELFGLEAGKHHLISVLFHLLNTLLLFFVLIKMTGDLYPSGAVAALFAIHPFHVESVAWVAERKDVLSTFFAFLTIGAYWWYSNRPSVGRYLPVAVLFAVGLMAKPMVMTLPFIMLLLDFWPLGRLMRSESAEIESRRGFWRSINKPVLLEKIPLFAMTVMSAVVTYLVQKGGASISKVYPLGIRIANALASCLDYVVKTFYPVRLAFFYPHPGSGVSSLKAVLGAGLIVIVTAVVLTVVRKAPYLLVGWFWFLGSLVPVIGLIQVGDQALADRYTYLSLIGLFVMMAWGIFNLKLPKKGFQNVRAGMIALVIVILAMMARIQAGHWESNFTLLGHAAAVTKNNYVAYYNLGVAYINAGRYREAVELLVKLLRMYPDNIKTYNQLGVTFFRLGKLPEAINILKKGVLINPKYPNTFHNLGAVYNGMGEHEKAAESFKKAIDLSPRLVESHASLCLTYHKMGKREEALKEYGLVKNLDPVLAEELWQTISR